MRIQYGVLPAVLAAAGLLLSASEASATKMLATYRGVVLDGSDTTDIFGLGGTLDGASFEAKFKYDTNVGNRTTLPFYDVDSGGPFWGGVSPIFSSTITINGVTEAFNTSEDGSGNVFDFTTVFGRWAQTFFYTQFDFSDATTIDGDHLQLFVLDSPNPVLLTTSYTGHNIAVLTPPIVNNEMSKFLFTGGKLVADYHADLAPDFVNLHPIPEPATWLMMIGGFGLIGSILRRTRRVAALA